MHGKTIILGVSAALAAAGADAAAKSRAAGGTTDTRPNVLLILVDDMGYSDIGCFGGEIPTPNLDRLAASGVRYTQFYTTARSCPTRASLMTGLYPHQAGIGEMSEDPGSNAKPVARPTAYQGYLNRNCVTMAEVLGAEGYHTYMAGKWHLGMHGEDKWPLQRGFERFYGILSGACSYIRPQGGRGLTLDNQKLPPPDAPYYTTDAFTDHALQFLESNRDDGKPFFLYLAYNAPHWPLHAKDEDIAKFAGRYDRGWESVRSERFRRMVEMGLVDGGQGLAEWESRTWDQISDGERRESARKMEVYAAQVHCMDYNVGRVLDWMDKSGQTENTVVVFLSDNGACAEPHSETGFGTSADVNNPANWVHPSYGLTWAQVSNTPLRKYKVRAYEGGLSAPMILSWPARYAEHGGEIRHNNAFLPDIMATVLDASGTRYPKRFHGGNDILPLAGTSILPTIEKPDIALHDYIFGEHYDNRYVRHGGWKAVKDQKSERWELFDLLRDRTESNDLATRHPELLERLTSRWQKWADTHGVYPKQLEKQ